MIIPILSVNLSLVRNLSGEELRTCSRRFGPLIGAALVGTVVGMAVLSSIPSSPLRVGLGMLTLGFVATTQRRISLSEWSSGQVETFSQMRLKMLGVGGISGLLFGGTNIGIQLIAYLRRFNLSHGLFVGVVALVFLGLNEIRVAVAGLFGLYPSPAVLVARRRGAPSRPRRRCKETSPDHRQRTLPQTRRFGTFHSDWNSTGRRRDWDNLNEDISVSVRTRFERIDTLSGIHERDL